MTEYCIICHFNSELIKALPEQVTAGTSPNSKGQGTKDLPSAKFLYCRQCNSYVSAAEPHNHENDDVDETTPPVEQFECEVCCQTFESETELKEHVASHLISR
ncbi:hypothetical protein EB796_000109 [Bugula neritina]|uniref:C2H2-type domain-containing protein n=1 Tax=Bugula neritina TaxID=10212 RepID=A0A7J7KTR0_BUGNE|nr:hypothetical protein EB796_000109 [Bugula neritina]